MVVVEGVDQAVAQQAVLQFGVAHAQPGARLRQHVGRQAHAFLAAGDDHFGVAATDRLHGEEQRLEARAAELVDGHGRDADRQAGADGGLARGVLAGAGGEYLAEDDFVDLLGLHAAALQQGADQRGAQFVGRNVRQAALEGADGGAGGGDYYYVLHLDTPSWLYL
ncbi:hypothetical protein D3C76_1052120 [compost metagenome]